MAIPEIEYNLHDSIIVGASFDEKEKMEVSIALYKIFYPEKPLVKLIISGIYNVKQVSAFVKSLTADPCEEEWLGYRINSFGYDKIKQSEKESFYLYFDVEHNKPLKIHCRKFNFIENGCIT